MSTAGAPIRHAPRVFAASTSSPTNYEAQVEGRWRRVYKAGRERFYVKLGKARVEVVLPAGHEHAG